MAEPLAGGELVDPHGGQRGPRSGGSCGWCRAQALEDDPLRSLRAVRIAVELDLEIDPATGRGGLGQRARDRAGGARARVRRAQAGDLAPTRSGAGWR